MSELKFRIEDCINSSSIDYSTREYILRIIHKPTKIFVEQICSHHNRGKTRIDLLIRLSEEVNAFYDSTNKISENTKRALALLSNLENSEPLKPNP